MPFTFSQAHEQLLLVQNKEFPVNMIEIVKQTVTESFLTKSSLLEVAQSVVILLGDNGFGVNWLCYIRPTQC